MHLFDAGHPLLRRQRDRRRRAAARRRAGPGRQLRGARPASRCASSATAPSPRASSTRRMNLAALWQLPVLFCCENNLYAMGTALEPLASRETDLALKAAGYEMAAWAVDGMDVLAVEDAARRAVDADPRRRRTRTSSSCATYRFRAHSMYDPERYRTKDEVERVAASAIPIDAARGAPRGAAGCSTRRGAGSARGRRHRGDRRRRRVRRGRHAGAGRGPDPLRLREEARDR